MTSQQASARHYFCPGEDHPISWSVHLARLSAFYPKCFECPLRDQTGHLPPATVERLKRTEQHRPRKSLLTDRGLRGVYLNEITRRDAGRLAAAFARLLAQGRFDRGPSDSPAASPRLVVGYQEHPSAPDLCIGVFHGLRRTGVEAIDVGLTTAPALAFAVRALGASGGIDISGSGCDPAFLGLDFVLAGGIPLTRGAGLEAIEVEPDDSTSRIAHGNARYGTQPIHDAYFAELQQRFHALRPLRVCVATPLQLLRGTLERLFEPLPCTLSLVELPVRRRDLGDPTDADLQRLADAVRTQQAHIGVLIGDDARSLAVIDEQGELVPAAGWSDLLTTELGHGGSSVTAAILSDTPDIRRDAVQTIAGGDNETELVRRMLAADAAIGFAADGRVWLADGQGTPLCDAIRTLALLLSALSRSDAELSARVHPPSAPHSATAAAS